MRYVRERFCENMNLYNPEGVGQYGVPEIKAEKYIPCEWIGFNYAKGLSLRNYPDKGVHFFLDDYQFERLWRCPEQNIERLLSFNAILSPDFSMFTDWPQAIQIYNHFRKQWFGSWLQALGAKVYPTICWSDKESFDWCFDGCPKHGTIAVSSVGTQQRKQDKKLFLDGYNAMLDRLEPETILFYGNVPSECKGNIVQIKAFTSKFREVLNDDEA